MIPPSAGFARDELGTVYLLHFSSKVRGQRHYVGFTQQALTARLAQHRSGTFGSQLARLAVKNGVVLELVKTWHGATLKLERQLKREKNLKRHCLICQEATGPVPPQAG